MTFDQLLTAVVIAAGLLVGLWIMAQTNPRGDR